MNARKPALYKYTKLEYIESALENGIFASKLYDFNDPYEYNGINNRDEYRAVCLTRSNNKKLMWSHYGNGHRGCSIQIEVPDGYLKEDYVLRPVKYAGMHEREGLSVFEGLYVKDKKWDYELEERAVWDRNNYDNTLWNITEDKVYFNVGIKAVIFGCMAQDDKHYLEALKAIKQYNDTHKKKIAVRKLIARADKFQFVLDKDFKYINEIKKLEEQNNGRI